MKKTGYLLIFSLLFVFQLTAQLDIEVVEFASGLSGPVDIQNAGDTRLFIVEQPGRIQILDDAGTVLSDPFLNITDRVNDNANERGLLGLAFHPNYTNNGFFYVNYTGNGGTTFISRFSVTMDMNIADPDSELILMEIDQPFTNHNGGGIQFGPDGFLYIGMGDGGSGGDPLNLSQNTNSLLGKMLRIDVDNGDPYAIPADNPFINNPDVLDEIWSIGLRNPWRFSFDSETGDLWIGDVGQNDFEEIDFEPAGVGGLNYGWRCYEGFATFNTNGCQPANTFTDPVWDYPTTNSVGKSVTGGYVYRGSTYPAMQGFYLYGDFVSGRIWSLINDNGVWNNTELLNWTDNNLSAFGEDMNGELYLAALGQGRIYRIQASCAGFNTEFNVQNISCFGEEDGSIAVTSTNPNATIEWDFGAIEFELEGLNAGTYMATVTDPNGCTSEISTTIEEPEEIFFTIGNDVNGNPSAPEGFASYQWFNANDEPYEDQTSNVLILQPSDDSFYVVVTDDNGCTFTSETIFVSDVNQIEGLSLFTASPNPFSDNINLSLEVEKPIDLTMEIIDLEGKVLQKNAFKINGNFNQSIDLNSLPKGVYFIRLTQENSIAVKRIIKQ